MKSASAGPQVRRLARAILISAALVACSTNSPDEPGAAAASAEPTERATASPDASGAPPAAGSRVGSGVVCPASGADPGETCQIVPGTANIFGAGRDEAPRQALRPGASRGSVGAGVVPPEWEIPGDATAMIVTRAVGELQVGAGAAISGPDGDPSWITDVSSLNGISGIVHRGKGAFLVGVFLADEQPRDGEHPPRLGFTNTEDFAELSPLIGQTFFIGDGVGRRYVIPEGATRLFIGFAEGIVDFQGPPGNYGNNAGQIAVTVSFTSD